MLIFISPLGNILYLKRNLKPSKYEKTIIRTIFLFVNFDVLYYKNSQIILILFYNRISCTVTISLCVLNKTY
jgi:hypothetical protein